MPPQIPYVFMIGEGMLGPSAIVEIEDIRQAGLTCHWNMRGFRRVARMNNIFDTSHLPYSNTPLTGVILRVAQAYTRL